MPNTIINSLTISQLRQMKETLIECRGFVNPRNNGVFAVCHPYVAPKLFWRAGRYLQALKLWYRIWETKDVNGILNSIPWEN